MAKTKAKRKTIGESPLDTVVPVSRSARTRPAADAAKAVLENKSKERLTIHVAPDLLEQLRDAVYWTPGLTLAGLAEDALTKALEAMAKKNGGPFRKRSGNIKLGRPLK